MAPDFSLFTSLRYDTNLKQVPSKGLQYAGWNYKNESPLYMLDYHRDRMLRAATHWKWDKVVEQLTGEEGLSKLAQTAHEAIGETETGPFRVRIVATKDGDISFQKFNVPALAVGNLFPETLPAPGTTPGPNDPEVNPRLTLVVDDIDSPRSEYTHFKTTNRVLYDQSRSRAGIGAISPADDREVLIINQEDKSIMEGSTTTPYFWRNGRWVTPPVSPKFSTREGSGGNDGTSRRWALER